MNATEAIRQIIGPPRSPALAQASAYAPANIALCKYWGKRDVELNLPLTSSLSVSLADRGCEVICLSLVENSADRLVINGEVHNPGGKAAQRMSAFLDPFRPKPTSGFDLETRSTIPIAAGLASSASAFAAVVKALDQLFGWELDTRSLSLLARMGSGSASRSIEEGFILWHAGEQSDGMDSFAERLDLDWPEFRIGLLTLSSGEKPIGSREAMNRTSEESPLYRIWPEQVRTDMAAIREALSQQDLNALGAAAERNALAMHATMMACTPSILYWLPESVATIHEVQRLRCEEDLALYLTMDAGPNVKLIFSAGDEARVREAFPAVDVIRPFR